MDRPAAADTRIAPGTTQRWPRLCVLLTVLSTVGITVAVGRWMEAASRMVPARAFDPQRPGLAFWCGVLLVAALATNVRTAAALKRVPVGIVLCTAWCVLLLIAGSLASKTHAAARMRMAIERDRLLPFAVQVAGNEAASIPVDITVLGWPCRHVRGTPEGAAFILECRELSHYGDSVEFSPRGRPTRTSKGSREVSLGNGWYRVVN